jgi:uncharacterized protein YuzE
MSSERRLRSRYDRAADVLYISVLRAPAARGIEDRRGIVWRYDSAGALIGVTIIDYQGRWAANRHRLAGELSERFHISSEDVERALPAE